MIIIPSIDISDGRCVRLKQGDFNKISYYDVLPDEIAKKYNDFNVKCLHVVDLDGSKNEKITQFNTIKKIRESFEGIIQVGGGLRTKEQIDILFDIGIDRIVIGSMAIKEEKKTNDFFEIYGNEKIVIALDFKLTNNIPYLAVRGWQDITNITLEDIIEKYKNLKYILSTDISKDGMQSGTNINFYSYLSKKYQHINFEASGGISTIEDIKNLKKTTYGAIIGKALFENKLKINEIIDI
jgi:phosphoribosylformimino-5-aminoimidazole carboxamide ribotide isomerase